MESMQSAGELLHLARAVLEDAGAPPATAAVVADSLVESNLRGHDSHGVRRLVPYLQFIRDGQIDPAAEPEVVDRRNAVVIVDGRGGFGQVAARLAVKELRRDRARARRRRRRDPPRQPRRAPLASGSSSSPTRAWSPSRSATPSRRWRRSAAASGGSAPTRRLGAPGRPPLVMDWSTATMPEGKLAVALARGEQVPEGVLVDARASRRRPGRLLRGGALLPLGAHKGSGLSVMIQLVGGALAGTGVFGEQGAAANGPVLIALDPAPSPTTSTTRPRRSRRAGRHQAGPRLRRRPRPG